MRRRETKHRTESKKQRAVRALAAGLLCAALMLGAALFACAGRAAPEGSSLKSAQPTQSLTFPLGSAAWRVSDEYGWRKDPFTGQDAFHRGVDLACAEGTPVLAALDGVVSTARRSTSYGNYLCLSHSDGQQTLYAHMQYLYVRVGEVVRAGQLLGTAGQTGRATGAHLHFEFLARGIRYDPGAALGLS